MKTLALLLVAGRVFAQSIDAAAIDALAASRTPERVWQ
jgi:hypothetical protein